MPDKKPVVKSYFEDRAETIPVEPVAQSFNANTNVTSSIKTINAGFTGGIGITKKIGFGDIFITCSWRLWINYCSKRHTRR